MPDPERDDDLPYALAVARRHRDAIEAAARRQGISRLRLVRRGPGYDPETGPIQLIADVPPERFDLGVFEFAADVEDITGMRVEVGTGVLPVFPVDLVPL